MTGTVDPTGVGLWSRSVPTRLWRRGLAAGALSAVAIGIPTDVISNPLFTRMTPTHWWDYAILAATALLTALWAALPGAFPRDGRYRASTASLLGALSVGCPICNKLVVALLGLSGALAIWAPLQPLLGLGSVALVLLAVISKWRLSTLTCPTPTTTTLNRSHACSAGPRFAAGKATEVELDHRWANRLDHEYCAYWPLEGWDPDEHGPAARSECGGDPKDLGQDRDGVLPSPVQDSPTPDTGSVGHRWAKLAAQSSPTSDAETTRG